MREQAESDRSAKQREGEGGALVDSPVRVTPLTSEKNPPPYGAQHQQDALWEGGNEALPPRWMQYEVGNVNTQYQDDNLVMSTWNQPLPGVRLDEPGDLVVPGCEWHISPFGRSYFVNHDTGTTSWQKPTPQRPAGSLTPECIMEGHSECIWSLACVGTSHNVMSASQDGSIRRWRRDGKQVGKPWRSDEGVVWLMAVSPEESVAVSGNADNSLRLWNMKMGSAVGGPWEGHTHGVRCLDWSPNGSEVASGSEDGTIRRWNPDTGRQITPPIETGHGWVYAIKYSPQGDKFASGGTDDMIRMWSKDGKLLIEIKGHDSSVLSLCWSKDGAHIFSGSADRTIRKWQSIDGKELVVLWGHTHPVRSICLSPDERHLVSASQDCSVRIWDLTTNQQVGEPLLHDDELLALAISSDGRYIASGGKDKKIYLWSIEAALKKGGGDQSNARLKRRAVFTDVLNVSPPSKQQPNNRALARYGDDFWGNDTNHTPHRSAPSTDPPRHRHNLFDFLRFNFRPVDATQPIPLQPRRRNFSLFTGQTSVPTVIVAPARDEDRYGIVPPTEAEIAAAMAAAMQRPSDNAVDSKTAQGQAVEGVRGSQVATQGPTQFAQGQNSAADTGEAVYVIGCCGFVVHRARRRSS